jgi:hypothetical protein
MLRSCVAILIAFGFLFCGIGAAHAATPYFFTDLGTAGSYTDFSVGDFAHAGGINANGVVAGIASTSTDGGVHGGFYYDGTMHALGEMRPSGGAVAYAVNAAGDIAGSGYENAGSYQYGDRVAFRYSNGTFNVMPNLGRSTNGLCMGYAYATNSARQVGGSSMEYLYDGSGNLVSNLTHALIWNSDGSVYADIRTLLNSNPSFNVGNSNQYVFAMNSHYAAGNYSTQGTPTFNAPFLFDLTDPTKQTLQVVPKPGTNFWAWGINDANVVIGAGNDPSNGNRIFAMKYDLATNTTVSLGTLTAAGYTYSRAYSINHGGNAVGTVYGKNTTGGPEAAVLYQPNGSIVDLNGIAVGMPAGWTLQNATAINDNGWIAGYGTDGSNTRAFLLKPALLGDADLNHIVDISDLSKVLTNYDKGGLAWADGDFDGNGTVDISDLSNVLANYDKSSGAAAAGLTAVPEPGMLALLASSLLALLACRCQGR